MGATCEQPVESLQFEDLGRIDYAAGRAAQERCVERVLARRGAPGGAGPAGCGPAGCGPVGCGPVGCGPAGCVLLLEHEAVITVSRRPGAAGHVLASPEALGRAGVEVAETDRGGDVTYHGPGQLVVYPILDLNAFRLRLHDYMRLLEDVVVDVLGAFGVRGEREAGATGVWVRPPGGAGDGGAAARKICAMGVRVRQWVSMHGLALNVEPDLGHFGLIVPCGLVGRDVTSLRVELGEACPPMAAVKGEVARALRARLEPRLAGGTRGSEVSSG